MKDRPYLYAGAGILLLIVLYYGSRLLFNRAPAVEKPGDYQLVETKEDPNRAPVPVVRTGWFQDRPSYKEWREQRETAFTNYMADQEEKTKVSEQVTSERKQLKNAMQGPAAKYYNEALEKIGQQRFEEAIGLFIDALKAEPNNTVIRLLTFKRMAMVYKTLQYEKRYCVAMMKYLDLLEKVENDNGTQERIRTYRTEIETHYNQLGGGAE